MPNGPEGAPDRTVATLVAIGIVALIGGAASGVALSRITDDEGGDGRPSSSSAPSSAERPRDREPSANTESGPPPRRRLLLDWPRDLTAHTVIIVTTSDRAAARRLARETARSGIEAGLLRGEDYDLGAGLWVVFAGRFDTPEGAARQASALAERFPGAYPRLVKPAG